MTPRSLLPLLLVLALAAVALPGAAETSDLRAGSMSYEGSAMHQGLLAALFIAENGDAAGLGNEVSVPWLAGTAGTMVARSYTIEQDQVTVEELPAFNAATTPQEPQPVEESTAAQATLRLAGWQPAYEVHVFALEGSLEFEAAAGNQVLEPSPQVVMEHRVFAGATKSSEAQGLDSYTFARREFAGPLAVHRGANDRSELTVRGDLVVEIHGLTLDVASLEGATTLASGRHYEAIAEGVPAERASRVRDTFLRLFLDDAELTFAADGGSPRFEWASVSSTLEPSGPVTFYHSYGAIGDAVLQDDRFVLDAGHVLAITPQMEGLAVDVHDPDLGTRGTIAQLPAPASAALVGGGAILALVTAIGLGLLRRVLHPPVLADVEASIEGGQFRRAARQAARILARRPGDENALLARAIALSKRGQQDMAVVEVGRHLAQRPVTDGSLHYVLGLAQMDLGQVEAGRASLREAVRLTPSLVAEVAPRLGKGFSAPSTTARETNGYA
jgi:hypothetical protein